MFAFCFGLGVSKGMLMVGDSWSRFLRGDRRSQVRQIQSFYLVTFHLPVKQISSDSFGLLIAYLLPGFVLIWGLRPLVPELEELLLIPTGDQQSFGDFLQSTIAAVGTGMTVSALRWITIDSIHHVTGIQPPRWDFAQLGKNAAAFEIVVEHYYRYYQFYANTFISLLLVFLARRWSLGATGSFGAEDLGLFLVMVLFFAGSRSTLRRYYQRGGQLMRGKGKSIHH